MAKIVQHNITNVADKCCVQQMMLMNAADESGKSHEGALQHGQPSIALQRAHPVSSLRAIELDVPLHGFYNIRIQVIGIHSACSLNLQGIPDGAQP